MTASIEWQLIDCYFIATIRLRQWAGGAEAMDYSYALMDLTVYGRQEPWEDSPHGWPQRCTNTRTNDGPPSWPTCGRRAWGQRR